MRDTFIRTLSELAESNPRVMLITGDLGFAVLDDYQRRFPKQFLNAGVAEQNMTTIAAGLAHEGRNVFTYSIANFPTLRCLEQIRNDVCYHDANVTVVSIGGGFSYGGLGPSHHATEDLAILRALPNMMSFVPSDLWETDQATRLLVDRDGPGFLRLDKTSAPPSHQDGDRLAIGKARMVRDGAALTVITAGGILRDVLQAAERLAERGHEIRVLTALTVSHLDVDALRSAVSETGGIVTVEEHARAGGLGGAVAEACMDHNLRPKVFERIGLPNRFIGDVGSQDYMKEVTGLSASAITRRLVELIDD